MTEGTFDRSMAAIRGRSVLSAFAFVLLVGITGLVALPAARHADAAAAERRPPKQPKAKPAAKAPTSRLRLDDEQPRAQAQPPSSAAAASRTQAPEGRLLAAYHAVAAGHMADALAIADALTQDHPNFRLAQLVRADLLAAHAAPLADFGAAAPAIVQQDDSSLNGLRLEALARLRALRELPPADAVPAEFVRLPASVTHAIAVDVSRARLYLFENSVAGMRRVADYYVTIGKQGADKLVEGDQRTPLGVYFIADRLDPRVLEERFGAGAMPLNYPNAHDKARGRTGGGIWLHGVPPDNYARPPLDSDGCVVLANTDLLALAQRLPRRDTPVVITRELNWVQATKPASGQAAFFGVLKDWQRARLRQDAAALAGFYAPMPALVAGDVRREPRAPNEQRVTGIDDDWSVLAWAEAWQVRVVTYRERYGRDDRLGRLMRQYWAHDGSRWAIQSESVVR
jgi:L,D-transpeptidase catalytic domain